MKELQQWSAVWNFLKLCSRTTFRFNLFVWNFFSLLKASKVISCVTCGKWWPTQVGQTTLQLHFGFVRKQSNMPGLHRQAIWPKKTLTIEHGRWRWRIKRERRRTRLFLARINKGEEYRHHAVRTRREEIEGKLSKSQKTFPAGGSQTPSSILPLSSPSPSSSYSFFFPKARS